MTLSLSFQSLFLPLKPQFSQPHSNLITRQAVVSNEILPGKRGRVKYQATYWFAVTQTVMERGLKVGKKVRVIERKGNTLVVQPY
ncbi:MAG: NfeD family protein [Cyanobacteria bacterium J06639_14]